MLKQRIITALILAPLALWGLFYLEGQSFALFTALVVTLGAWEWARLSSFKLIGQLVFPAVVLALIYSAYHNPSLPSQSLYLAAVFWLIAFLLVLSYPKTVGLWRCPSRRLFMGVFVLIPAWAGLMLLKQAGSFWLLYVLLIAWVADIGAYFAGRKWGKRKLAPKVSPGKSWEGVLGGLAGTGLLALGVGLGREMATNQILLLIGLTLVVTLVSVLGDLTESMIKREAGMKDSSNLLPGHGGILDRIDSLTSALPIFYLLAFELSLLRL